MLTEAEARAYLSARLPGLREPCPANYDDAGRPVHLVNLRSPARHSSRCMCGGTGEVARDWHLEDLLAAVGTWDYGLCCALLDGLKQFMGESEDVTNSQVMSQVSIAAALALQQEEKP